MSPEGREIHIQLPRDLLETLLKERQASVPFQTDELGFPLRIIIWGAPRRTPPPRFGSKTKQQGKEEEDG